MRRFGWLLIQMLVLIFIIWAYGVFGTAFVNVPRDYQWILALLTPYARDMALKLLRKVVYKAAGEAGAENAKSINFLTQHYITTKHAIFLAVIVGGVATPVTSACLMAIDFGKTMQAGWKILKKYKTNQDVEGKFYVQTYSFLEVKINILYFTYLQVM